MQASVNELVRWLSVEDARTLLRCMETSDLQAAELVLQVCFGAVPDWMHLRDGRLQGLMTEALQERTHTGRRRTRVLDSREALRTTVDPKYNIA